jgi:NAD(P)-dependent dehydrogenase (short-subunit alcohol dehydrogenase family)
LAERKVALVTGAGSGLGAAVAGRLAAAGWTVAALDRDARNCRGDLVAETDVRDAAAVRVAVDQAARLGPLSAVACCAGIFRNTLAPVHAITDADWADHLGVNLTGAFHVVRAALPHLVTTGGAVVLVSSVANAFPQPGGAAYAASKAGVALARAIALEYGPRGVRANSVSPGYMETPMAAPLLARPHLRGPVEHGLPARRVADPDEVAAVIEFLLSPAAGYITGEDVRVDGAGALSAYTAGADLDRMWRRSGGTGAGTAGTSGASRTGPGTAAPHRRAT